MLRIVVPAAVLLWLVSAFWVLITFDFSPDDSVFEWLALVIFVVGIVAGLLGVLVVAVSAIQSGRREKKQWE
jgi:H+/Cl- antiporter ClcA